MSSNPSILVFGMGTKAVDPLAFNSIQDAFNAHADELGAEKGRAILVRANGETVSPSSRLTAGTTYSVSISLGDKGGN